MKHEIAFYSTVFFFIGMALGAVGTLVLIAYSAHLEWKHNQKNKKPQQ